MIKKVGLGKGEDDITARSNIVVPMREPVVTPASLHKTFGTPHRTSVYRLANGDAFGAVLRWDIPGRRKEIRPVVWDGATHIPQGFGENRPLYNSDLIAQRPLCPVLIVEGEKTADGAPRFMPDGWVVTTWQGGASAVGMTDWSLLVGHRCVIWPDNDTPGLDAAEKIRLVLTGLGVESAIVPLPSSYPDGWDLGDDVPTGIGPALVTSRMLAALATACIIQDFIEPEVDPGDETPMTFIDAALEFKALGYDKQTYYVMPGGTKQIEPYSASTLMTEKGCMEIVSDADYWLENFGERGRVNWIKAGVSIMNMCRSVGVYDESRIRSRGVWMDDGRVVLNLGDTMEVNGHNADAVRFKSRFIYEKEKALLTDGLTAKPADDVLGKQIRGLCNLARWERPMDGDLFAGWIATAPICGGLMWRTHCWITGNHGSGKTTLVNNIAAACLGEIALYPLGATTEAGIRSAIGNDARPVVFDEAESGSKNSRVGEERRQAVIQLMRGSSSESPGRIMKGSASHTGVSFTTRSAFLLSSIGVGLKEAADLSRTTVLTVKPLDAADPAARELQEAQWKEFNAASARLPSDLPQRLLARQTKNLLTIRKNIEVFKEVIAASIGNRRMGDQLGTLLAGCYSLISEQEITTRGAESYMATYNWDEFTQSRGTREDMGLITHIRGSRIRVEAGGLNFDRTIGELVDILYGWSEHDDRVSREAVEVNLARNGFKRDPNGDGILMARSVQSVEKIMAASDYAEGWMQVLLRHPDIVKDDATHRFAGVTSRAILLPKEVWK